MWLTTKRDRLTTCVCYIPFLRHLDFVSCSLLYGSRNVLGFVRQYGCGLFGRLTTTVNLMKNELIWPSPFTSGRYLSGDILDLKPLLPTGLWIFQLNDETK